MSLRAYTPNYKLITKLISPGYFSNSIQNRFIFWHFQSILTVSSYFNSSGLEKALKLEIFKVYLIDFYE